MGDPKVPLAEAIGTLAEHAARGKDPAHWRQQLHRAPAHGGSRHCKHGLGAEPLQPRRSCIGGGAGGVRGARHPISAVGAARRQITAMPPRRSGTVAKRHRATPNQIAIAALLAHSPMMLPIPGTSRVAHLEENVAAAGIELSRTDRSGAVAHLLRSALRPSLLPLSPPPEHDTTPDDQAGQHDPADRPEILVHNLVVHTELLANVREHGAPDHRANEVVEEKERTRSSSRNRREARSVRVLRE